MFALPDLPTTTGSAAYTIPNTQKGFIYNGQLDIETTSTPRLCNLTNIYKGNIADTYGKVFQRNVGTILEETFDEYNVPTGTDFER